VWQRSLEWVGGFLRFIIMFRIILFALAFACTPAFAQPILVVSPNIDKQSLVDANSHDDFDFNGIKYSQLEIGRSHRVTAPHGSMPTRNQTELPYLAFELPPSDSDYTIAISSKVVSGAVFVPHAIQLDNEFNILESTVLFEKPHNYRMSAQTIELELLISQQSQYLILTTLADYEQIQIAGRESNNLLIPTTTGDTTIYTKIQTGYQVSYTKLSGTPDLVIHLPQAGRDSPVVDFSGWFLEMGSNFGGETVAVNPKGDNYSAGGGALLGMGYSKLLRINQFHFNPRIQLAYRYQGGDGSASGVVLQGLVAKTFPKFILGAGFYLDMNGKVKSAVGETTQFNNAMGAQAIVEFRASDYVNLYLRLLSIDYQERGSNIERKGDTFGVGLTFAY